MIIVWNDNVFAKNLKRRCRERHMSRLRLAKLTGLPWGMIRRLETDTLREADHDDLLRLAGALATTPGTLIEGNRPCKL